MMMKWIKAYAAAQSTGAKRSDGWLREAAVLHRDRTAGKAGGGPGGA